MSNSEQDSTKAEGETVPEPKTEPLEGKTTVGDTVVIESAILAYHSMSRIAENIASLVKDAGVRQAILFNEKDMAGILELRAFNEQAAVILQMFKDAMPKPEPAAKALASVIGGIATVVVAAKTVLDLLALFRSDVELKGADLTLDDSALAAEVARNLLYKRIKVFYPQLQPLAFGSSGNGNSVQSSVIVKIRELQEAQDRADQAVAQEIAKLKPDDPNKEARTQELQAPLTTAKNALQALRDTLVKVDDTTGTTALSRLVKAETLENWLGMDASYLLYLKVLKSGGNSRTLRTLVTSKAAFSGGAIVTYMLFAKDGSINSSKTIYSHSGFREFAPADEEEFPLDNF